MAYVLTSDIILRSGLTPLGLAGVLVVIKSEFPFLLNMKKLIMQRPNIMRTGIGNAQARVETGLLLRSRTGGDSSGQKAEEAEEHVVQEVNPFISEQPPPAAGDVPSTEPRPQHRSRSASPRLLMLSSPLPMLSRQRLMTMTTVSSRPQLLRSVRHRPLPQPPSPERSRPQRRLLHVPEYPHQRPREVRNRRQRS